MPRVSHRIFPFSASSTIFVPSLMESYSSFDATTSGIFARAHPEAVVRSAFKQIIACGAHLLDFREYIVFE